MMGDGINMKDNIAALLQQSELYGKVAGWKPLLNEDKGENPAWNLHKKIKIKSNYVWRNPGTAQYLHNTIPLVEHGGGSILLVGVFFRRKAERSKKQRYP